MTPEKLNDVYPSNKGGSVTPRVGALTKGYSFTIPLFSHFDLEDKELKTADEVFDFKKDPVLNIEFLKSGENAQPGIIDEQLINILLYRQKMWKSDNNFPSDSRQDEIIEHYESILQLLKERQDDRIKRKVQGTYKK